MDTTEVMKNMYFGRAYIKPHIQKAFSLMLMLVL